MTDHMKLFYCGGCRYEFMAPDVAVRVTIDCPNCDGNKHAYPYDD